MERLNGAATALVEFDWDGLDDPKSDTTQLEESMTAALGINYQCSTGNGFLTGTGNGNGNGKKCRERE